jgi:hypothetical protein
LRSSRVDGGIASRAERMGDVVVRLTILLKRLVS